MGREAREEHPVFEAAVFLIGIDIYNFFNSDVPTGYNTTYTPGPANPWLPPTTILAPRFIRAQVQFNF